MGTHIELFGNRVHAAFEKLCDPPRPYLVTKDLPGAVTRCPRMPSVIKFTNQRRLCMHTAFQQKRCYES